tara:strand:- start:4987 stop:5679 length:693 start_codon:yes stop_codon:yes gene_type:complete
MKFFETSKTQKMSGERVPFTLTYVTYDESSDYIGLSMALLTLTPIFIVVALTAILFVISLFESGERNATSTSISFLMGQLVNDGLSRLLKEFVASSEMMREMLGDLVNRPLGSDRDECGVPSNHAHSVAFFSTFASYLLLYEVRARKTWVRDFLIVALYVLMFLVATSRVYLEYHTPEQVSIGVVLGLAFAFLWINLHRFIIIPELSRLLVRFQDSPKPFIEFSSHRKHS